MRASDATIVGRRRKAWFPTMVALLAIAVAGSVHADPLPYTGTLEFQVIPRDRHTHLSIPASGTASVSLTGNYHIASLSLAAGAFGPVTTSLPTCNTGTVNSVIFTAFGNLTGFFPAISGGPPGGGAMGLSGTAKICLVFAPCAYAGIPLPLTGFGIGGTQVVTGAVSVTVQHNPWTLGQPAMTIHTPVSNVTSPDLSGGFAHGPASVTSSTAAGFGELQLVTVTKAYTSLTTAFPEFPLPARLHLAVDREVCDDGADNDGDGLIDFPADPGCDDAGDGSELSSALLCDNGLDDDGDGLVDFEDPGCDDPTDPSEQSALIACDDGTDDDGDGLVDLADPGCAEPGDGTETDPSLLCDDGDDNDGDGLVDTTDPGCDEPLDPFEQNCGVPIPFTTNETEDAAPAIAGSDRTWHPESKIVWQQWDGSDLEVLYWDGATATPLTDNLLQEMAPTIGGTRVAWEEWGTGNWRVMLWTGSYALQISDPGVDAWSPDTDGADVVWSQGPSKTLPPEGVYHRSGSTTALVFGSAGGLAPAISGDKIVWETDAGIHMWTGTTTVLIPGSAGGHAPAISGQKVVWHASDGSDDEVYLWNGSTTQPLTDNASDDRNADISGNRVVWESAEGIQVWLGGETSLVAGSLGGKFPKVDGLDVVWQALAGGDNEIFLVTLCVGCNDGVDNDGDEKIDYDGGLSALGYMAAEADPQCGDNPWKPNEAPYFTSCGLGTELALLLPALLWAWGRRRSRASSTTTS